MRLQQAKCKYSNCTQMLCGYLNIIYLVFTQILPHSKTNFEKKNLFLPLNDEIFFSYFIFLPGPFFWWKVKSLSHVWLFATPQMVAYQAPWSMGFSKQEWAAISFSRGSSQPRDWTRFPALQTDALPSEPLGKPTFWLLSLINDNISILKRSIYILKRRIPDHLTCLLRICMQVKKQQLQQDMEQWTGSRFGKEYVKAVYCHLAYLTYIQSTSCEMPSWMKHKLELRLLGEIWTT